MLPDKSVFIGQKLVENAKIQNLKCDIFGDFQTLCKRGLSPDKEGGTHLFLFMEMLDRFWA